MRSQALLKILVAAFLAQQVSFAQSGAVPASASAITPASLLTAQEAGKIMPATVFFRGLSASIQARNSGGVRFPGKTFMLVSLVDTSGYSSQVQEKYQAYLLTEEPIEIEGHRLPPGAYGCGFVAGDTFVVQDLGAHDLFTAHSMRDPSLRRPTPLQVTTAPNAQGEYRLYAGRSYISFHRAAP